MELNESFFGNVSRDSDTDDFESDVEAKLNSFLMYLSLFGWLLGVLLVAVPALVVVIIILKNRKLREKSNNIFYANLLITDVVTTMVRWIVCSIIVIGYLLDVPIVNCNVLIVPLISTLFATDLMFLTVVIDRFLHIAWPFSYKRMVTTKRIAIIIIGLWLQSLACGILSVVGNDYTARPETGVCEAKSHSLCSKLFTVVVLGTKVTSTTIITGTCIYLHYKIIHSKRFFNSVKKSTAEEQKAIKVGRLMEILQEQLKPTFSVFIAGGIDAVFNGLGIVIIFLVGLLDLDSPILYHVLFAIRFCQYFSHAVVYGLHNKYIYEEIVDICEKIRGPKKSKVIVLNGQ